VSYLIKKVDLSQYFRHKKAKFKIIKTEFISQMKFDSLEYLTLECSDYVNWYNKLRIHGTLGYVSPIDYKQSSLKKAV